MSTGMLHPGQALAESGFAGVLSCFGHPVGVATRAAIATSVARSRTRRRLYAYNTRLERPAQRLQAVVLELWAFIQKEHPIVRQRHFACSATRPPPIRPTSKIV